MTDEKILEFLNSKVDHSIDSDCEAPLIASDDEPYFFKRKRLNQNLSQTSFLPPNHGRFVVCSFLEKLK
jgi:hypothetical protein